MPYRSNYSVNGKRVPSLAAALDSLLEEAKSSAIEETRRRIEATRCPKHGKTAKVASSRQVGDRITFEISGCCDELVKRAQQL